MAEEDTTVGSVEERMADKIFGPEADDYEPYDDEALPEDEEDEAPEEEQEEEVEEPEEEYVEIEIDGELVQVPEKYKDYFLRQQDYTQKTQEVAAQRKELEVRYGQVENKWKEFEFAESIQGDVLKAQQLDSQAQQYHDYLRANIDNLSSTEIEKIRFAIDEARRDRDQIVQSVQGKQQQFQQAQEQSLQELLKKGTEVLKAKIPGWNEQHQRQVRDFALSHGFTEEEVGRVLDPREVEVLWKASQYDALQKGKPAAVRKVKEAPTIKPKSRNPMPDDVKQKLNLRKKLKSGRSDKDKADYIREDIADRLGL